MMLRRLLSLLGLAAEEGDPLKREIEEMRRAARAAIKEAERKEKKARKAKAGKAGLPEGGDGGLSRAAEEMGTIFSEVGY